MIVMVCNAGSTSLKFKLYRMPEEAVLCSGGVERVGSRDDAVFKYENRNKGIAVKETGRCIPDYQTGIRMFLKLALGEETGALGSAEEIDRVGFKTVLAKGYYGTHIITDGVLEGMRELLAAAPVHNGCYLEAIAALRSVMPETVFVGAFETAFHQTIPMERRVYGLPYEWIEKYGVQRMGYHGASHGYVADCLRAWEGAEYRAVSCHMGGSGSLCAIENGESRDSSFGMTLQTGLIHNNRTGDVDPDLIFYLRSRGLSEEEIREGYTKKGGLLGISGVSNDLRYVLQAMEQGNERAALAVRVYVTGIVRYIGAFAAELGALDAIAFTGGIGENSAVIRKMVCERLGIFGVKLSEARNEKERGNRLISEDASPVHVYVVEQNEELGVARRTYACEE